MAIASSIPAPPGVAMTAAQWTIIHGVLAEHIPDREVWAFGSRVNGQPKPFSDLDLAILGDTDLSPSIFANLVDDLRRSDLPFKVDVVVWATTGERFREIIRSAFKIVQVPRDADQV